MAALMAAGSCSDKNDPVELPDLSSSKTYSGTNLELYYNGELMPGKTAVVSKEGDNLKIDFSCSFDLSQLTGMGLTGSLPGPGVTPGTPQLTLTGPLAVSSDEGYVISGKGETEYVSFNYSGKVADDKMVFNISDSKLKNTALAGNVFAPAPVVKDGLASYSSLPFHLVWEIDPSVGIDIPLSEIMEIAVTAPIIPVYNNTAYTSLSEAFVNLVKTVALTDGGSIPVMYVSTLGGAAHLATSSSTMMQYVPAANGLKLYLNPLSVMGEVLLATSNNKNDEKFDFEQMLKKAPASRVESDASASEAVTIDPELKKAIVGVLLKAFAPSLANGIPLTVAPTQKGADIYLDTQTSVTFMATVLNDALQNPVIAGALKQTIVDAGLPNLDPTMVEGLLQQLPTLLMKTTKFEVGLSFVKAK